jgi:hypothetical protein
VSCDIHFILALLGWASHICFDCYLFSTSEMICRVVILVWYAVMLLMVMDSYTCWDKYFCIKCGNYDLPWANIYPSLLMLDDYLLKSFFLDSMVPFIWVKDHLSLWMFSPWCTHCGSIAPLCRKDTSCTVTTQEFRCVNFAKIKNFLTEIECYPFSSQIASPLLNSPPD